MYQGVCEEEYKGYICMNKENKDVEFIIEKACTCQGLATESVCHYEILCQVCESCCTSLDVSAALSKTLTLVFVSYSILRIKTWFERVTQVVLCNCQLLVDGLRHFCSTISCINAVVLHRDYAQISNCSSY